MQRAATRSEGAPRAFGWLAFLALAFLCIPSTLFASSADSLGTDSLAVARPYPALPERLIPAGAPEPSIRLDKSDLARSAVQEPREAVRDGLGIEYLDSGAPHRCDPIFWGVPGRDIPELRVDGIGVGPVRWPETAFSPVPLVIVEKATLRRYSPIQGPLSSTGGPSIDLELQRPQRMRALSVFRLTQGSFGTFTEELALLRPFGRFLVTGYYGDSKSDGRGRWFRQYGQTIGGRIMFGMAGGWFTLGADEAFHRSNLLGTKRGLWDRATWSLSWVRPDSGSVSIETSLHWNGIRGAWDTTLGRTQRRGRSVTWRGLAETSASVGKLSAVIEADFARVRYDRPEAEQRLLEDSSVGVAVGWEHGSSHLTERLSCGVVRLAPLEAAPVFSGEVELRDRGLPRLLVHASRAVRNRTLPRLPADGSAWVRAGLDLAAEDSGEVPEALWRFGLETGYRNRSDALSFTAGVDLLHATKSLSGELDDLSSLGTDAQEMLPADLQRGEATFLSPWLRSKLTMPFGFRLNASVWSTHVDGGVEHHLGLPGVRFNGELGWSGLLFKGDLLLDLLLRADGRSEVATPYGSVPAAALVDGEIKGRLGSADLFFVLANLLNANQRSMTYDGGFMQLPLRHYRAGVRWAFVD